MQQTQEAVEIAFDQIVIPFIAILSTISLTMIITLAIDSIITPNFAIQRLKDKIPTENNPNKESLLRLINHKKFKKLPINLQNAINEKLKCSSYKAIPIEATMTTAQLFDINSPLWTANIKIELIAECYELQQLINSLLAKQNNTNHINLGQYIQEYIIDRQQGMSQLRAQKKQLDKIEDKNYAIQSSTAIN
mgnify:CR=1 FL=1